jgi:hypothetical protein
MKQESLQEKLQQPRAVQKVREGKHWYVPGKTGSGKTSFVKHLYTRKIQRYPHLNLYVVDSKKLGDFDENDGVMHRSFLHPPIFTTGGHRVVWQPMTDDREEYSKFFMNILQAGLPSVVVIDECINMRFGQTIPRGLSILISQGRLPGIDVIGGTQRVAKSPSEMLSQASYIACFLLKNKYDERTMAEALDLDIPKLGLKGHEYLLLDTNSNVPAKVFKHYKDLPDKFI